MCCCMSTPAHSRVTLVFHTARPQGSLTGKACWGSPPLWATNLYERRMFVSAHECVCVCVRLWGRCMTLLDIYGLRSDLEHHCAWKTEGDTHTRAGAGPCMCSRCVNPKKKQIVRPRNCWQSLCYCLQAHCGQPDNPLYSASLPSPLKHLIWVFLPADWGFQLWFHPQVHPEIITWQWHRPLFPFSGLPLKCILPPILTHTPFKKHEHTNTNTPFL